MRWLPDWLCRDPGTEGDARAARYTANRLLHERLGYLLARDPQLEFLDALTLLGVPVEREGKTRTSVDFWQAAHQAARRE